MLRLIENVEIPAVESFSVPHMYRDATTMDGVPFAYIDPRFKERFSASDDEGFSAATLGVYETVRSVLARDVYLGTAGEIRPAQLFAFLKKARSDMIGRPLPGSQFGPTGAAFMRDDENEPVMVEFYMAVNDRFHWWCIHLKELFVPVWSQGVGLQQPLQDWDMTSKSFGWTLRAAEPLQAQKWISHATQYPQRPHPRLAQGRKLVLGRP